MYELVDAKRYFVSLLGLAFAKAMIQHEEFLNIQS